MTLPVNERTAGDTRANAITNVDITVDPAPATTDLREIRAAIKQALIRSQDAHNERLELLPLVPLLPQGLVRRSVGVSANSAASVVSSNLGAVTPAAYRPDGTDADYIRHEASRPGCDQGDHAPARRIAGVGVGKDARTGLRFGHLRISRAVPTRMTACDRTFRAL